MKKIYLIVLTLACSALGFGQVSLTTGNTEYTDGFTGFNGNSDPTNWLTSNVASTSNWNGNNQGSSSGGAKYSYGNLPDGSLGFLPSSSRAINADISFTNDTGNDITGFDISYVAEQWRSTQNGRDNGWAVSYQINAGTFIVIPTLDFRGSTSNSSGALSPPLTTSLSETITVTIPNGSSITIRFFGDNGSGSGSRQGVAIDDFSIDFVEDTPAPTLAAGDIAFVDWDSDSLDEFSFVVLTTIPSGTVINFTDKGWQSAGGLRNSGGDTVITWTAPITYSCGDIVNITPDAIPTPPFVSYDLSDEGDQILAFQGSEASPTFIAAIQFRNDSWDASAIDGLTSALPPGLTNGLNAVAVDNIDNGYYDGSTLSGSQSELLMAINDRTNWITSNSATTNFTGTISCVACTVTDISDLIATPGNMEVDLSWTTSACFDEMMIVASDLGSISAIPTGDGSTYTADANYGSGTNIAPSEFVVYKDTGSSATVTALTNGTNYFFKVFTRKDNTWSAGVEISATPNLNYCIPMADGLDGIRLVNFGDINNATTLSSGYIDYTALSTNVALGETINLTVNLEGFDTIHAFAYFDWNIDGDFDDPGETYDLGDFTDPLDDPTSLSPLPILIPATATLGSTRMRIYSSYEADPTGSCDATDDEVEDYTINIISLDQDTEIYEPLVQVDDFTVEAANTTTVPNDAEAFGFVIEDQGTADGAATNVTKMRFVPGPNNTADWATAIAGMTLYGDNLIDYTPTATITTSEIILDFGTPISIADGASLEFVLGFYLNTSGYDDGDVVQFQINGTSSGFEANASGSGFADPLLLGTVTGNETTINVVASELEFTQEPTNTTTNSAMNPDVIVSAIDSNGNLDTDYTSNVSITSTGTLDISPQSINAIAGVATFSSIAHTAAGTGLQLTATDGTITDATSALFDIVVGPDSIWFEPFTDNSLYTVELGAEGNDGSSDYFHITDGSNIGISYTGNTGNFFAGQDIDDTGWAGSESPSRLAWTGIDIANYTSLEFSGMFASDAGSNIDDSDFILLEYRIDAGTWQNLIAFENDGTQFNTRFLEDTDFNGDGDGTFLSDTFLEFTKSIPTTGSTLDLRITIAIDSGGEDIALEDFMLTGFAPTPVDYVYDNGWLPADPSGLATSFDNIIVEAGFAPLTAPTEINNVTVFIATALSISEDASLEVSGTLSNDGTVNMQSDSDSYSSLIADNLTGIGDYNYNRHVNITAATGEEDNNDLISAPVTGLDFETFAINNPNIVSNGDDTLFLFGPFDKLTGMYALYSDTESATLDPAVGYRAASTDNQNFIFSGTVNTGDIPIGITISGPQFEEWNLIGNPYPSYIKLSDFLTLNNPKFDSNAAGVYGYDGDASDGWTIWNLAYSDANPDALIAPGQGFLVASATASETVNFNAAMRRVGTTDDFIPLRNSALPYLKLTATNGTQDYFTDFYFNSNASLGLDHGYDASVFGGNAPDFAIYSQLVQDNAGVDMAIQSLGLLDVSDVIIPLGVNASNGQQITISIENSTLDPSIEVYLEDTATNTFTLLNTSDYTFTSNEVLSGTGRFFLRYTDSTLSSVNQDTNSIQIYTTNTPRSLFVKGQLLDDTTVEIYDIQGRMVLNTDLDSSATTNTIDVSNFSTGIYVVKLQNSSQQKTQKVIIR